MTQLLLKHVPLRCWVEEDAHGPWALNIVRGIELKDVSPDAIHSDEMSAIRLVLELLGLERNPLERKLDLILPGVLQLRVVEKTNGSQPHEVHFDT